ncbi:MAG: arginine deiminase-related protein [Pantoea sp.]|uniref:arginine deiminase-related protein n=1 Tax=Pantoea sp. TaxID=69393 RepID=UPI0039E686D3
MITRDLDAFFASARQCADDFGPATARAAFLVSPDGFSFAAQSASDNRYMAEAASFDAEAALHEHRALQMALREELPVIAFAGSADTPDAVFPNNVFATAPGKLVVGRMRHAVRQREARRDDIRAFFTGTLGYAETDLSQQPHPCELTGALVIDRARGLGFCGLSERCDERGAALMHAAFGLRATLMFDLKPGEYHLNVLLAILAGRAALVAPNGFADARTAAAIADFYAPHAIMLTDAEQAAFAANAISLGENSVWMSAGAARALTPATRAALATAGFGVRSVALEALEAAGGSLRCCVAEIF